MERSEDERKRERDNERLQKYKNDNPDDYIKLQFLQQTNNPEYTRKKAAIIDFYRNQERERARPDDRRPDDRRYPDDRRPDPKYDLSGLPANLSEDKAKAIGLKTEIENHILTKLSDYIISKHPRGNYTTTTYQIAIVNVLRNIFKDPNSDIITYIENKLKGESSTKSTFGFFGFGGTKRKRKRKSRRR